MPLAIQPGKEFILLDRLGENKYKWSLDKTLRVFASSVTSRTMLPVVSRRKNVPLSVESTVL